MHQKKPVTLCHSLWPYQLSHTRAISQKKLKDVEEGMRSQEEWATAKPTSAIPGPTKYEFVRGFLPGGVYYKKPINDLMQMCRKTYGDFYRIPGVFGKPSYFVSFNPDDFSVVLRSEGVWPMRRALETMVYHRKQHRNDVFGDVIGLLGSNDAEWGKLRSVVNPVLMQPKNVQLYVNKMLEVNNEFLQRICKIRNSTTLEMPANFEEEIKRLTFESIAVVALDQQIGVIHKKRDDPEVATLFESLRTIIDLTYDLDVAPSIWKFIKTPKFHRIMTAHDNMCHIIMKYVNQALERIESESETIAAIGEKSVLEKLLKIDKRIAVVMALDLLMAGVDTTSSTLTGILLCIAKNPEKQDKLRHEIRSILPEKDSPLTVDRMKNLPYLRACIKESMRIYPVFFGTLRANTYDLVMSGYRVPKDCDIILNSGMLQMEEKYYRNAEKFIPERWLRTDKSDSLPLNPFIYMPFGLGPRSCVGKRLVNLELEITVARLVRNFHLEFNYSTEKAFKNHMINVPAVPLKFKLTDVEN